MNTKSTLAFAMIAMAFAVTTLAQQAGEAGGVAISSEPGKAEAVRTSELSAEVVGIEKATRKITLKGPQGATVNVVLGEEVKNFDQIKLGEFVVARYTEAVALKLRKTGAGSADPSARGEAAVANPGERPAFVGAGQVTAIVKVVAVDKKKSAITLEGPRGDVVTLDVHNPEQFEVVKEGDEVEVTYTEALALSVEPAPAKR